MKELNESNTKVYINDKEIKYTKYFRPTKEGIYNIKIKFNIKIKDCSFMFHNCVNIISIDLSSFDASCATDISYTFFCTQNVIVFFTEHYIFHIFLT